MIPPAIPVPFEDEPKEREVETYEYKIVSNWSCRNSEKIINGLAKEGFRVVAMAMVGKPGQNTGSKEIIWTMERKINE